MWGNVKMVNHSLDRHVPGMWLCFKSKCLVQMNACTGTEKWDSEWWLYRPTPTNTKTWHCVTHIKVFIHAKHQCCNTLSLVQKFLINKKENITNKYISQLNASHSCQPQHNSWHKRGLKKNDKLLSDHNLCHRGLLFTFWTFLLFCYINRWQALRLKSSHV